MENASLANSSLDAKAMSSLSHSLKKGLCLLPYQSRFYCMACVCTNKLYGSSLAQATQLPTVVRPLLTRAVLGTAESVEGLLLLEKVDH